MKVAIISYIFPPNTTMVSGLRPLSWYTEFGKCGLDPIVITRHWDENPILTSDALQYDDLQPVKEVEDQHGKTYYLPYKNDGFFNLHNRRKSRRLGRLVSRLAEIAGLLAGRFTNEANMYDCLYSNCCKIIEKESPDALVVTALPLSTVKLGYKLSRKFRIPLVVDFRDHWNNNLLNDNFKFSRRARFYFFIQELYIKRWLGAARLIVSVSQPILDKIKRLSDAPQLLVHNGYESHIFDNCDAQPSTSVFTIGMIGMLYPTQDIDFIIAGFKQFLERTGNPKDCVIEFIGQDYAPEVSARLKAALPADVIKTTPRIPRQEALRHMKGSHVLYYAGWRGWKGIYSGKIFEYLAAKRNILLAPGDEDVIDDLLAETKAGIPAYTVNDFAQILTGWYSEWKKTGQLQYRGDEAAIAKYGRERIAQKFAIRLKELIRENALKDTQQPNGVTSP